MSSKPGETCAWRVELTVDAVVMHVGEFWAVDAAQAMRKAIFAFADDMRGGVSCRLWVALK